MYTKLYTDCQTGKNVCKYNQTCKNTYWDWNKRQRLARCDDDIVVVETTRAEYDINMSNIAKRICNNIGGCEQCQKHSFDDYLNCVTRLNNAHSEEEKSED